MKKFCNSDVICEFRIIFSIVNGNSMFIVYIVIVSTINLRVSETLCRYV